MRKIKYNIDDISFGKDWLQHKNINEWWFITGILYDEEGNLYSYQFILIYLVLFKTIKPEMLFVSVTDHKNKKRYYQQDVSIINKSMNQSFDSIYFKGSHILRDNHNFKIIAQGSDFSFNLRTFSSKGPVMQCIDGKLKLGRNAISDNSFYYSYPNLITQGEIILNNRKLKVKGKSSFDRQGGSFSILDTATHWVWISMRFNNEEEIMVLYFPQVNRYYGNHIEEDGKCYIIKDIKVDTLNTIEKDKYIFGNEWTVRIDDYKSNEYHLKPFGRGWMNLSYYDQFSTIIDNTGEEVGHAFVVVMPGAYNEKVKYGKLLRRYLRKR